MESFGEQGPGISYLQFVSRYQVSKVNTSKVLYLTEVRQSGYVVLNFSDVEVAVA